MRGPPLPHTSTSLEAAKRAAISCSHAAVFSARATVRCAVSDLSCPMQQRAEVRGVRRVSGVRSGQVELKSVERAG